MKSSTHLRDRLGPDAAGCHRSGLRGRGPGAVLQDGLDVETRRDRTVSPAHAGVSVSWFSCCTTRLDLLPSKAATVVTGSLPSRYAPRILAPAGAHPFGIGRWCSHKPTMPEEEAQAEAQVDGCEEPPTGAAADSHGSAEEEASAAAAGAGTGKLLFVRPSQHTAIQPDVGRFDRAEERHHAAHSTLTYGLCHCATAHCTLHNTARWR